VILPEVLAPTGYNTAMSGKRHLSGEPTDFGFTLNPIPEMARRMLFT
jgi:arylsulfatase A-like enzyme